jgi:hypothetical protein
MRRSAAWFLGHVLRLKRTALLLRGVNKGLGNTQESLLTLRSELAGQLENAMADAGIHAAIMPPAGIPAGIATSRYEHSLLPAFVYSALCSVLGFPSGGVPVTRVSPSDLKWPHAPSDTYDIHARHATAESDGVPVSCSVFAPPFRDELCLQIMEAIASSASFVCSPPSLESFVSTWPGPQREAKAPNEESPLLASEAQDWVQEFTSTIASKVRRLLKMPAGGGQRDLWSLGTV